MKRTTLYGLSLILTLGVLASATALAQGQCPAEIAEKWAESNSENLPSSFEKIAELPLAYRKAVYRRLSHDTRSELWRQQFEYYLDNYELTDAQKAVLFDALELATPAAFTKLNTGKVPAWLISLEQRAREAFGSEQTRLIFGRIGRPESEIRYYVDRPHSDLNPTSTMKAVTACSCSDASDYCSGGFTCESGSGGCTRIEDECGTFWVYDCDGLCELNQT